MKKHTILFLIITVVTGLIGFAGFSFSGIEIIRVVFLIFADLLIISLLASFFFSDSRKMRLARVRK